MYQIDNSTAAAAQPASTAAGTAGFFTDGNPAGGVAATIVPAEWLNAVMMELINIVTAGGLTPSKNTFNQVLAAIKRLGQNTILLADTGAANAYTAANATPLVAGTWVDGVVQAVKIAHANTGPSTYAPDGLPAIPIYGLGLQPLQGGELALDGTAVLMRLTIPGVNSGNPIAVLMECAGGAQQIVPATQSNHAATLGQSLTAGVLTDVKASRVVGTTYTNSTGRPIFVYITVPVLNANDALSLTINSASIFSSSVYAGAPEGSISALIPVGATYKLSSANNGNAGLDTPTVWSEIR